MKRSDILPNVIIKIMNDCDTIDSTGYSTFPGIKRHIIPKGTRFKVLAVGKHSAIVLNVEKQISSDWDIDFICDFCELARLVRLI